MPQLFTNNARALLTSGIGAADTSLVIEAAKADLFPTANTGASPVPAATNWFKCTLQDSAGNVEIVYVRTRVAGSGVLSNVLRGQEGTTARTFNAGTVVGLRVTASDLQSALSVPALNNTFSGNNTFTGANAFSQAPTAPTAAPGTSNTTLANTEFVQAALQAVYPVGSIYINASSATNPSSLLGFGTWVEFGAGRVVVGQNASDALFDTLEETGGSKDAIVVSHTHTATVTDPGHTHTMIGAFGGFPDFLGGSGNDYGTGSGSPMSGYVVASNTTGITVSNSTVGSSGTNANLPPYIVVKMWKRTA